MHRRRAPHMEHKWSNGRGPRRVFPVRVLITRAQLTAERTTLSASQPTPKAKNRPQKPYNTRETSHASDTLSLIKHKVRSLPQSSVLVQLSTKAEYGTGSVRQSRSAVQPPVSCDGGRRRAPLKTQERGQGLFGKFTSVVSGLGVKLGGQSNPKKGRRWFNSQFNFRVNVHVSSLPLLARPRTQARLDGSRRCC